MTSRKDPYKYVRCKLCGNVFRVIKSALGMDSIQHEVYIIGGGSGCPKCGGLRIDLTTRKEWLESNEVKPDKND